MVLELVVELAQSFRNDFGTEGWGVVDLLGELRRACQSQQPRAVDVDHVQGNRYACRPPGLGDELVWDEMGRHLVEYARDLESDWCFASELPGALVGHGRDLGGDRLSVGCA